jgi:hypothetical protein
MAIKVPRERLREHFFWPGKPGERGGNDFMESVQTKRKNKDVILAVDHHTGWIEAAPTKAEAAEVAAKFLLTHWILRCGAMGKRSGATERFKTL